MRCLAVALALSLLLPSIAGAGATVEAVPDKWRRVNVRGDVDPNVPCVSIARDGVEFSCPPIGRWSGYAHMLPGGLYEWTIGGESVLFRAPGWAQTPNVGDKVMDAAFFRFPGGAPAPFSIADAQRTLDLWTDQIAAESFNRLRVNSTAHGWFVMPLPISDPWYGCDYQVDDPESVGDGMWVGCYTINMRRDAEGILQSLGINHRPIWMVFTETTISGAGTFIGASASNGFQRGPLVMLHEYGHSLGAKHGGFCGTGPMLDAPEDYRCPDLVSGYGDNASHMGVPIPPERGRFTIFDRVAFGWLPPSRTRYVHISGQFDLYESRHPVFRVVELRVPFDVPSGVQDVFYSLEYRADEGGAIVRMHWGHPKDAGFIENVVVNQGRVLSPGGDVFTDPWRGIAIRVTDMDPEKMTVEVSR